MRVARPPFVVALLAAALVSASVASGAPPSRAQQLQEKAACLKAYDAGQVARSEKHLRAARESFVACSAAACPTGMQKECTTWLAQVESAQPGVVVRARAGTQETADVRVVIDGEERATRLDGAAILVDPGEHRVRLEHAPLAPIERTVVLAEGDKLHAIDAEFALPDAPRPPPKPLWPVILAGAIGVVGVGAFAVLGATGASRYNDLKSTCSPHCDTGTSTALKTQFLVADVSLGVGVVALGVGTYLFLTRNPSPPKPSSPTSVRLDVGPRGAFGAATFAF